MNMAQLLETFREEAAELLQQMETILLRFDSGAAEQDDLHALFRTAHTLKGSAGLFGYQTVVEFTHVVENVLDLLRGGKLGFSGALIEVLLQCHQHIGHLLEAALGDDTPATDHGRQAALLSRLTEYAAVATQAGAAPVAAAAGIANDACLPTSTATAGLGATDQAHAKTENRVIKISADRLDRLIDLVGELVIAGAGTHLKASHLQQPDLLENVAHLQSLVEEVRDTTLSLRMVQVGEVFSRFPRVVRDLSKELGKNIDLTMSGHETELDKAMVEKIVDPLMHIIRNAIDHGIEMPADREAAGKNPHGTLHLSAYHQSGGIVIELTDDGRGLDKNRIFAKAVEKGLISGDAQLSEQEIFNLVLLPGFSTADRVTNLSGRGVGMDVVRSSVEALRGTLHIDSSEGRGTQVRLCLPLTLAIIDAFQIGVGASRFVLPLEMVSECVELPDGVGDRQYVNLRGHVLPFIRLSKFLNIRDELRSRRNIVVVRHGNRKAGIEVDNLLGECQAVIKPLGELFRQVRGISGTTILGSGDVALILDIPQLIELAEQQHCEQQVH